MQSSLAFSEPSYAPIILEFVDGEWMFVQYSMHEIRRLEGRAKMGSKSREQVMRSIENAM